MSEGKCYNIIMIGYLKGIIISIANNNLILEIGGVGYRVSVPGHVALKLKTGAEAEFFIHSYVREDQFTLYGFPTHEDLELFELLISVSGVGPKVALSIISGVSTDHIRSAISGGEAVVFTKVAGVGRKTAERIIIELKEKISKTAGSGQAVSRGFSDGLDALVQLGYSQSEAREALRNLPPGLESSGDVVRAALKLLAKH